MLNLFRALMDANTNLHNQEAFDLRRKYDPEGARTVGVITKPDRIEKGNEFGVGDSSHFLHATF